MLTTSLPVFGQDHYDWGMRAVKSVLVVAGMLKRAEPSLPEDSLLMRALRDFNTPKIVHSDEVCTLLYLRHARPTSEIYM